MKRLLQCAVAAVVMGLATPAVAQIHVGLGIRIGPPAPQKEVVVARPYRGAVWVPGYYKWAPRHHEYVWVRGHWERPPHARMVWVPGRWEQRRGEWVFFEGRWEEGGGRRR